MQGQRQSELTAEVELLPTTDTSKAKQTARVPISMNFEVRCEAGAVTAVVAV